MEDHFKFKKIILQSRFQFKLKLPPELEPVLRGYPGLVKSKEFVKDAPNFS